MVNHNNLSSSSRQQIPCLVALAARLTQLPLEPLDSVRGVLIVEKLRLTRYYLGGFGTNTNTAATGNSMFGAPKPTTGFGGFGTTTGTTSAFGGGGTGAFGGAPTGTNNTGGGIFGAQPTNNTTSAFGGTGTGLFGAKPATGFGAATSSAFIFLFGSGAGLT